MRPRALADVVGQEHLLSPAGPIGSMSAKGAPDSFIMWGPPGTGKTTIARALAEESDAEFRQLNAVSSGVRDVRAVVAEAREARMYHKRTILFIDEIHRFNKSQQDALLGAVEAGDIVLIGATTENPSFEVIPALRSRMRIFTLEALDAERLVSIFKKAVAEDEYLSRLEFAEIDYDFLAFISGGDARAGLNALEAAARQQSDNEKIVVDQAAIETATQRKNAFYDKAGEEHFNIISAFIKSVRGSDPDAALYWMARMLEGGEDPLFIARRLVVLASEDVGNAAPNGLVLAQAAFDAVHQIGMPEARIILAQCAAYLAAAPKSNAAYLGIDAALAEVRNSPDHPVPLHLRNAPTKFMKDAGYAKGYQYAHDHPHHFVEQDYLPDAIKRKQFYHPTDSGQEKSAKERLAYFWGKRKKY
jgi:putative ATPase